MRPATLVPFLHPRRHGARRLIRLVNHAANYSSSSSSSPSPFNPETYLHQARQKFASQPPTLIPDMLSPTHSHLLTLSLAAHVPDLFASSAGHGLEEDYPPGNSNSNSGGGGSGGGTTAPVLPQGHHLVYFPLRLPPSRLMPDGTDPAHWPGPPFARRMWAGGSVVFADRWRDALRLDGRRALCVERVLADPVLRAGGSDGGGGGGEEKVFVQVKREYGVGDWVWNRGGEGEGPVVEEVRRLVFLREREGGGGGGGTRREEGKQEDGRARRLVKASATPEFAFSLRPDATLLFHFSALTYNAHAIHIDPDYARNREGYRGLLVHGPLTLVLMLSALRAGLRRLQQHQQQQQQQQQQQESGSRSGSSPPSPPYVKSLDYRNLAPLYVDEEMRVCVRRRTARREGAAELEWDVWIEGPEGGLAAKGSAVTTGIGLAGGDGR